MHKPDSATITAEPDADDSMTDAKPYHNYTTYADPIEMWATREIIAEADAQFVNLSLSDHAAWQAINAERGILIERMAAGTLSVPETRRLTILQLLVRKKVKATVPAPFSLLEGEPDADSGTR